MSRSLRPLVVLAVVALMGAGCSNGAAERGSTGSGAARSTATTGGQKNRSTRDTGVKFAECMRNNAVPDFPDPDSKGEFAYGVSVTPAVFTKAVRACKDLQPPGALSSKRSPKQERASLGFAQCVRENGVKDFPDPVNGEPAINTYKIPSTNRPGGMAILDSAIEKCRALMDKALAGR